MSQSDTQAPSRKQPIFVGRDIDDFGLTPDEFRIYGRISRRGECTESAANMAKSCIIGERTVRLVLHVLLRAGLIEEEKRPGRSTTRRVTDPKKWINPKKLAALRKEITAGWSKKPARTSATIAPLQPQQDCNDRSTATTAGVPLQPLQPTPATIAAEGYPMKAIPKGYPNTHTTQLGNNGRASSNGGAVVCVDEKPEEKPGSRFSQADCRKYAEHLKASGQGINNPGGFATKIFRTGEADSEIEAFLTPKLDVDNCPDCHGQGMYYPKGITAGVVAKCKHPQLQSAAEVSAQSQSP